MLFAKTTIKEVKLDTALKFFQCYIQPIFDYNLVVWSTDFRLSCDEELNSVFTIYLTRYMGLNYGTRSSIVHFLTETQPFRHSILDKGKEQVVLIEKKSLSFSMTTKNS